MSGHILVVLTEPVAGREDEYNDWYDHTHLRDVVGLDGFASAQRYAFVAPHADSDSPLYRYLAIYEVPEGQLDRAREALAAAVDDSRRAAGEGRTPDMYLSPAMNPSRLAWWFEAISERVEES